MFTNRGVSGCVRINAELVLAVFASTESLL